MFKDSNILVTFLAIMPALLYVFIFFLFFPSNFKVDYLKATKYLINGVISTIFITLVQFIFPNWSIAIYLDSSFLSIFILSFFQVGMLEEGSKMLFIKYGDIGSNKMSLLEMFFYSTLVSVGFSISENFLYLMNHGADVLLTRACTATVAHFTFGIMMSYFITLAKVSGEKKYWIYALALPVFAHGLYDFNLFAGDVFKSTYHPIYVLTGLIVILQASIYICNRMVNNIKNLNDSIAID